MLSTLAIYLWERYCRLANLGKTFNRLLCIPWSDGCPGTCHVTWVVWAWIWKGVCACVCVCVCGRARARACVCVCYVCSYKFPPVLVQREVAIDGIDQVECEISNSGVEHTVYSIVKVNRSCGLMVHVISPIHRHNGLTISCEVTISCEGVRIL